MKTFTTFLNENITQKQLNAIESYADRLFRAVDIDVEFTRHFIDRVNDSRNKKQITQSELIRLFNKLIKSMENRSHKWEMKHRQL